MDTAEVDIVLTALRRHIIIIAASTQSPDLYREMLQRLPKDGQSTLHGLAEHFALLLNTNPSHKRKYMDALLGTQLQEKELASEAMPPALTPGLLQGNDTLMRRFLLEAPEVCMFLHKRLVASEEALTAAGMVWSHLHPVDVAAEARDRNRQKPSCPSPRSPTNSFTHSLGDRENQHKKLLLLNLQLKYASCSDVWCQMLQVRDGLISTVQTMMAAATLPATIIATLSTCQSKMLLANVKASPEELRVLYRETMIGAKQEVLGYVAVNGGDDILQDITSILDDSIRTLNEIPPSS
eukprot:PhF_6_TR27327/c0_g1_i1/m.40146